MRTWSARALVLARLLVPLLYMLSVPGAAEAQQVAMRLRATSGMPDALVDALVALFEPRTYNIASDEKTMDVVTRVCGSVTDHYLSEMDKRNPAWRSGKFAPGTPLVVLPCLRVQANARYGVDGTKDAAAIVQDLLGVAPDDLVFIGDPTKPNECSVRGCVISAGEAIARQTQLTLDQLAHTKNPSLIVPFRTYETVLVLKPVPPGRDAVAEAITRLQDVQNALVSTLMGLPPGKAPTPAIVSRLSDAPLGATRAGASGTVGALPQLLKPSPDPSDGCGSSFVASGQPWPLDLDAIWNILKNASDSASPTRTGIRIVDTGVLGLDKFLGSPSRAAAAPPRFPQDLLLINPNPRKSRDLPAYPYVGDRIGFDAEGFGRVGPVAPKPGLDANALKLWRHETLPWHGTAVAEYALGGPDNIAGHSANLGHYLGLTFVRVFTGTIEAEPGVPSASITAIKNSLVYPIPEGIHVVNMSLGGKDEIPEIPESAGQMGMLLLVAAAGNDKGEPGYPAAYATMRRDGIDLASRMIAVGAHDPKGLPTSESNRGEKVELFAPGCRLKFNDPEDGAVLLHGTSLAAPLISFTAALLHALGEYGPEEIKTRLIRTAHPKVLADSNRIRLLDAIAALQTKDTTVILRYPEDIWPIPSDRYRRGKLEAFAGNTAGYTPTWCHPTAESEKTTPLDYGRFARIDVVTVDPGDADARRFKAEITLRDPNNPLNLLPPVSCHFSENDIGPQFDLLDDKGNVSSIQLEEIQAIIPPMDVP